MHEGLRQAQAQVAQGLLVLGIEESDEEGVQKVREKGLGEELGIAWEVVSEVLKGWRGMRGCWLHVVLLWRVLIKLARGCRSGF